METPVQVEEADDTELALQRRLIEVQVHPIDALHLEIHTVAENVGHGAG